MNSSISLLATFCNLPKRKNASLFGINFELPGHHDRVAFEPVKFGFPKLVKSATGMTNGKGRIFVIFSPWLKTYISILNESDLTPVKYQALKDIRDGHSILFFDSGIYIVSTGTD